MLEVTTGLCEMSQDGQLAGSSYPSRPAALINKCELNPGDPSET